MPAPSSSLPPATPPHLGIIGLGLIGGSLALAARQNGWRVSAYNRNAAVARAAADSGDIDQAVDAIAALGGCDVIFIAIPMTAYDSVFAELAPALSAGSVVMDGGSTKQAALAAARQLGDYQRRFVAAHPIAGKEQSGWAAASADLFADHLVILCPENSDADAVEAATELWQQVGARTVTMAAATHDEYLALVSHLPHLLAYAMVSTIETQPNSEELLQLAAGGFRDFTRIAASHPDMWRDICLTNGANLLQMITRYQQELSRFADYIKNRDRDALAARMTAARDLRQQWLETLER